jgi:hypothetical protein
MSLVERMSTMCLCWADMVVIVLADRYESMRRSVCQDWLNVGCVQEEVRGI